MSYELDYYEATSITPLERAITDGVETRNALLLDYCRDYVRLDGDRLPDRVLAAKETIDNGVVAGTVLRWLDVCIDTDEATSDPKTNLRQKITRSLQQSQDIKRGGGQGCYVAVPALNEAGGIVSLIDSLRNSPASAPVALVVADNNSTDNTAQVVRSHGGNVVPAPTPGIGPACQVAVERILRTSMHDPTRTLIVRTDADCIAYPGYIDAVATAFQENSDMLVGVGPSVYKIPREDGTTNTVDRGRAYGDMFGTQGLRGYFELTGRDPDDYLLPGRRHHYLAGPNTTFRASVFQRPDIHFPGDRRWEMVDLAVKIQMAYPSDSIVRVEGQCMGVSPRAVLGVESCLTDERLQEIRDIGYVPVFSGNGGQTPHSTMRLVIDDIDRRTYSLGRSEHVIALADPEEPEWDGETRRTEGYHAATGKPLGKVAIIGYTREAA